MAITGKQLVKHMINVDHVCLGKPVIISEFTQIAEEKWSTCVSGYW